MKSELEHIKKRVAKNLRILRNKAGYKSASKFAEAHQMPVQTYLNHEAAKRGIQAPMLWYYAGLLRVCVSEFFMEKEENDRGRKNT
jgi:hypothetical protein